MSTPKVSSIFIIVILFLIPFSSSSNPPYSPHCSALIPASPSTLPLPFFPFLISSASFSGGRLLLPSDPNSTFSIPRSLSLRPLSLHQTLLPSTLRLSASLTLRGGSLRLPRLLLSLVRPRSPRSFSHRGRVSLDLAGFWSASLGQLCMVGSGFSRSNQNGLPVQLSTVFKLNFPNVSTIETSVVTGSLESLDAVESVSYFDPVRVLAYAQREYEFTKVGEALRKCQGGSGFGDEGGFSCGWLRKVLNQKYKVRGVGLFLGRYLAFREVRCLEDGRVRMYIAFSEKGNLGFGRGIEAGRSLVVEGAWEREGKRRVCLIGCRVVNGSGVGVGGKVVDDCTIGVSLWFLSVLSIEDVSVVSGRVWSNRNEGDEKHFDAVSIGDVDNRMLGGVSGVKYKYTKMDRVERNCVRDETKRRGDVRYPDMNYVGDLRFDMSLTNAEGSSAWGYANPRFVGEELFNVRAPSLIGLNHSFWNVSYKIGYTFHNATVYAYDATEITAEGNYDSQTGMLCMVGCLHLAFSMDCEVLINVQLAPLNPKEGEHLTGVIRSTREESDTLYFKPLQISSYEIYKTQAIETIRWMDIEIVMVLISLTFSCIFIGLQLFHVKKNPDVLPSISITMLVILTLGHMIPLVLTFEALFSKKHNQQNDLLQSGGWLQLHEVVLRAITLVAFLLQFRLLQIVQYSRSENQCEKRLWDVERKTFLCCLPLYIVGGLFALVAHFRYIDTHQKHSSLWADLMSYAGLILDSFLLPQFIFNIFYNSKEKSLAPSFYIGTAVVRALPHVYDAYRAHHYVPRPISSYIYASKNADLYSSAWDIIIPCEVLVLAMLIYLQQRFGGAFILPRRIKEAGGYEMVSVENQ